MAMAETLAVASRRRGDRMVVRGAILSLESWWRWSILLKKRYASRLSSLSEVGEGVGRFMSVWLEDAKHMQLMAGHDRVDSCLSYEKCMCLVFTRTECWSRPFGIENYTDCCMC